MYDLARIVEEIEHHCYNFRSSSVLYVIIWNKNGSPELYDIT